MPFDAGAVTGVANLITTNWTRGVGVVTKTAKAMGSIVAKAAKIGFAAVAAGMTASIVQANAYQKEFANVSTLTNQNTKSLQKMSLGLLSLDSELGSTRELTKSMYDAISAGAQPGADALQTVTDAAKFAKAGLADNAAAVKLLSATTNAYGRANISTTKAADIFFTTIKKGVVTGEELAGTIGQSIPLFASMEIPVEQLASGMAAMTKQGVSASESTTQLNAIVNAFLKPSEALSAELERQGFASGEAFIKAKGLTGALELMKGATESGRAEIAQLTPNIRAMRGVMALSGQGAIEYADTLDAMADSSGAVNEAFKKQEKTFATFKNEVSKTAIIVGNIGKSFVDDIAGGAQTALEAINNFLTSAKGMGVMANIAGNIAGAFSLLKTFGEEVSKIFKGQLFDAVDDIKKTFAQLFPISIGAGDAFGFIAGAAKVLGGMLTIIVSVLRLVATTLLHLINVAIKAVQTFDDLWAIIKGEKTLAETKDAFLAVQKAAIEMGKAVAEDAINVANVAKEQWESFADDQDENAAKFKSSWEEGSAAAKNAVQKNFLAAVSGVKNDAEDLGDAIPELLVRPIEEAAGLMGPPFKKAFEEAEEEQTSWSKFVDENLISTFDGFSFWADKVLKLFGAMFTGISDISSLHFQNEKDKLTLENQEKLTTLDDQTLAEQEALQAKLDQGLITQEQFDEQSEALDKKHALAKDKIDKDAAKKANDLAKKQFKAQKAFQIGQTWMDAARATLGFWSWGAPLGPPGWATAGTMTTAVMGMAGVKTGLIAKQQFVPSFAVGTDNAPGGISNVGEAGIELVGARGSNLANLARGAEVLPNAATENLLSGGRGETQININNPVVREEEDINKIAQAVSGVLAKELQFA